MKAIPKAERFVGRPSLEEMFKDIEGDKEKRDRNWSPILIILGTPTARWLAKMRVTDEFTSSAGISIERTY